MSTPDLIVAEFRTVCGLDGPGFSLCAAPFESLGPVFQDRRGDGMDKWRSRVYWTRVSRGGYNEGRS